MEKPGYIYLLRIGSPNSYRIAQASPGCLKQRIYQYGYGRDSAVNLIGFVQVGNIAAAKRYLVQLFEEFRNINPSTQRSEHTFRFNDLSHVYREYARITRLYPISENLGFKEDIQGLPEDPQFIEHLKYYWNSWDSSEHENDRAVIRDQFAPNSTFTNGAYYPDQSEISWGPILGIGALIVCALGFFGANNKMSSISTDQAKVIPFQGNQAMNVRFCANKTCDSVAIVSVGENVTIVREDVNGWSEIVTSQRKQGFIDPRSIKRIY